MWLYRKGIYSQISVALLRDQRGKQARKFADVLVGLYWFKNTEVFQLWTAGLICLIVSFFDSGLYLFQKGVEIPI